MREEYQYARHERYRFHLDENDGALLVGRFTWDELDALNSYESYVEKYPTINIHGEYEIRDRDKNLSTAERWVLKYDKNGYIHLNPRYVFHYPYSYIVDSFMQSNFDVNVALVYRYTKFRILTYRGEGLWGKNLYNNALYVRRYFVTEGQASAGVPIIMDRLGIVLSGATPYTQRGDYTTKW